MVTNSGSNLPIKKMNELESNSDKLDYYKLIFSRDKTETYVKYLGKYKNTTSTDSEEIILYQDEAPVYYEDNTPGPVDVEYEKSYQKDLAEYHAKEKVKAMLETKYAQFQSGSVPYEKKIKKHEEHDNYKNENKDSYLAEAEEKHNATVNLSIYAVNDDDFVVNDNTNTAPAEAAAEAPAEAGGGKRRTRKAKKSKKRGTKKAKKSAKRKSRKSRR